MTLNEVLFNVLLGDENSRKEYLQLKKEYHGAGASILRGFCDYMGNEHFYSAARLSKVPEEIFFDLFYYHRVNAQRCRHYKIYDVLRVLFRNYHRENMGLVYLMLHLHHYKFIQLTDNWLSIAINSAKLAAKAGDGYGAYALGLVHLYGIGKDAEEDKVRELFQQVLASDGVSQNIKLAAANVISSNPTASRKRSHSAMSSAEGQGRTKFFASTSCFDSNILTEQPKAVAVLVVAGNMG